MNGVEPIGFRTALTEQLRWVWRRLWIWWVILAVLIGGSFMLLSNLLTEHSAPQSSMAFGGAVLPLMQLIMLSWALSVWRDDPPRGRDYFWLQPVRRESHTLSRVLAGLAWLVGILLVAGLALSIFIAVATELPAEHTMPGIGFWLLWLGGLLLAYLLGNVAAILSDKPAIWIVLLAVLVLLLDGLASARGWAWVEAITDWFTTGAYSLGTALFAAPISAYQTLAAAAPPGSSMPGAGNAEPAGALLLWLALAIAAVIGSAFVSRPR